MNQRSTVPPIAAFIRRVEANGLGFGMVHYISVKCLRIAINAFYSNAPLSCKLLRDQVGADAAHSK